MNKLFITSLLVCLTAGLCVAETPTKTKAPKKISKEQFVASKTKSMQKKGLAVDKAKIEAKFHELDKNMDGFLDTKERAKKSSPKKAMPKKTAAK